MENRTRHTYLVPSSSLDCSSAMRLSKQLKKLLKFPTRCKQLLCLLKVAQIKHALLRKSFTSYRGETCKTQETRVTGAFSTNTRRTIKLLICHAAR